AEGAIADALVEQRQHDEPRRDESAVGDAVDFLHARPDRRAEDDEIERGGDDRRNDALQQRPAHARHFKQIDGPDSFDVHLSSPTSSTKISSSELCSVETSLTL